MTSSISTTIPCLLRYLLETKSTSCGSTSSRISIVSSPFQKAHQRQQTNLLFASCPCKPVVEQVGLHPRNPFLAIMIRDEHLNLSETINASFETTENITLTTQEMDTIIAFLTNHAENTNHIQYGNTKEVRRETPTRRTPIRSTQKQNEYEWEEIECISDLSAAKYRGQVFDSFLLYESTTHLYLIDQVLQRGRLNRSMRRTSESTSTTTCNA